MELCGPLVLVRKYAPKSVSTEYGVLKMENTAEYVLYNNCFAEVRKSCGPLRSDVSDKMAHLKSICVIFMRV